MTDETAPHLRMTTRIFKDGDAWCCLFGRNLMDGVAGYGNTPEEAVAAFDENWTNGMRPLAPKLNEGSAADALLRLLQNETRQ